MRPPPPTSPLFPYTTLFRSAGTLPVVDPVHGSAIGFIIEPNLSSCQKTRLVNQHGNSFALQRSEEHTSELQSRRDLVCRLLLEKKKKTKVTGVQKNTRYDLS